AFRKSAGGRPRDLAHRQLLRMLRELRGKADPLPDSFASTIMSFFSASDDEGLDLSE
ncbi:unnamed protein product, partial [Effrenium voratum]